MLLAADPGGAASSLPTFLLQESYRSLHGSTFRSDGGLVLGKCKKYSILDTPLAGGRLVLCRRVLPPGPKDVRFGMLDT
jgi:hypothetical protein